MDRRGVYYYFKFITQRPAVLVLSMLSAEQNVVENVEVVESLGSSDHNSIEFSVITQVQLKESKESVPDFRRANFQAFRSYIAAIEWRAILNGKSVEYQ